MGACKVPDTQMQDKESNGEKGGGDKEGHLGFDDVDAGHNGHGRGIDGIIQSRLNCGTIE